MPAEVIAEGDFTSSNHFCSSLHFYFSFCSTFSLERIVFRVLPGLVGSWWLCWVACITQRRTHTPRLQVTDPSGNSALAVPREGSSCVSLAAQVTSLCPVSGRTFCMFPVSPGLVLPSLGSLTWEALVAPSSCRPRQIQAPRAWLTLSSAFAVRRLSQPPLEHLSACNLSFLWLLLRAFFHLCSQHLVYNVPIGIIIYSHTVVFCASCLCRCFSPIVGNWGPISYVYFCHSVPVLCFQFCICYTA